MVTELLVLAVCPVQAEAQAATPAAESRIVVAASPSQEQCSRVWSYLRRHIVVAPAVEAVVPMPRPVHANGPVQVHPVLGPLLGPESAPVPLGARPGRPAAWASGWKAIEGGDRALDELELARAISDPALALAVEEYRARVKGLRWVFAASAPLLAGAGTWLWIEHRRDRDVRAVAYSLFAVSAVSAAAALFADAMAQRPIETAEEAHARAEAHNAKLRSDLGITPADLAACGH